jgi:UDP-N-acetylmuramate--alanine ligase
LTDIDLVALAREKPIHFMGIGGAGMAPLAELVRRSGGQVTGCDSKPNDSARTFEKAGVEVSYGHSAAHVEGCGALIVTAAVPGSHPEIAAARDLGIPVMKRAEALGAVVNPHYVVGIAGTHGKTSTTALTTAVLEAAGLDPTGLVGGRVQAWGGNLRLGGGGLFVVEADEYDHSFLKLRPNVAVVTTLEADHLDIFGSLRGVEEAFLEYVGRVEVGGLVIACADDMGVGRMVHRLGDRRHEVITYGLSAGSMLRADRVEQGEVTSFDVWELGKLLGRAMIRVPGTHNIRNALAAVAVARHMGVGWDAIREGLAAYHGVERRFERVGEARGVLLVDDYAHHPTEIAATLQAARYSNPGRRIVAVFQPHLYSRTRDFGTEFGRTLARADLLFVTDIYPAREQPIPGVTGELIVDAAAAAGGDVRYLAERSTVARELVAALRPGDLCLTLGAGDLNEASREILRMLGEDVAV